MELPDWKMMVIMTMMNIKRKTPLISSSGYDQNLILAQSKGLAIPLGVSLGSQPFTL